jgi:hypothetical protein
MRKKDLSNIPTGTCKCSVCGIVKDNTEFPYYGSSFYNKGPAHPLTGKRKRSNTNCFDCIKIKSRERAAIKKKCKGIKPPEFGIACECCGKPVYSSKQTVPKDVNGTWVWQLDHCHDTGEFRGWLCKQCNTGLGNMGDTLQSLRLAVEYLERAQKNANTSQQNLLLG